MLVTLSLVFCLATAPTHCQTLRPDVEDGWTGLGLGTVRGRGG